MGRTYAGILGPLAFAVVVTRGLVEQESVNGTLYHAAAALFAFAAIGYVIGFLAERTIIEAIDARFHAQLQANEPRAETGRGATGLASDQD